MLDPLAPLQDHVSDATEQLAVLTRKELWQDESRQWIVQVKDVERVSVGLVL